MTVGTGDYVEVWARNVWEETVEEEEPDGSQLAEGMEKYGI